MDEARQNLQRLLGYCFRSNELMEQALRHESYAQETSLVSQERLEFLGDSVVGLVVSSSLYQRYPELSEGRLAIMKASLVCTEHLADRARQLGLGDCVELGRSQPEGSRNRPNLLADTLEALLGAIYLESGYETVREVVLRLLEDDLQAAQELRRDFKTLLQEASQREFQCLPEYEVLEEKGPPHDRLFRVEVRLNGQVMGMGEGRSKREAGQRAAERALENLGQTFS